MTLSTVKPSARKLWIDWSLRVLAGASASEITAQLPLADLVELLATAQPNTEAVRDVLSASILARFAELRRDVDTIATSTAADLIHVQELVVQGAIAAGDEDAKFGATEGYEARNAAREQALDHAHATAASAALARAADRLDVLVKTNDPSERPLVSVPPITT